MGKPVRLDEPSWWYPDGAVPFIAQALAPVSKLYSTLTMRRFQKVTPYRSRFPVVCIGNFTAGGTGKTPLAIYICEALRADGEYPVFLTRGYKGRENGPLWVDTSSHTALDVGDEPLLLARVAPTLVSKDRQAGAKFIESFGRRTSIIIMDDGLQNPQLEKDLTIAVLDARRMVGNGRVIPSGPLRASLSFQLGLTDTIVMNGGAHESVILSNHGSLTAPAKKSKNIIPRTPVNIRKLFKGPIVNAKTHPRGDIAWLRETPIVAFAGIGNPERFFKMLTKFGASLSERRAFPDHHVYSEQDAKSLLKSAFDHGARLVSTEKDLVRLSGFDGARAELASCAVPFPIELTFSAKDDIVFDALLKALPGRDAGA